MAYNPTEWKCGDTITAEKLNKMEDGIANCGGGTLRVNIANIDQTEKTATYDKTWQEVHDALESGMNVTYQYPNGMYFRILAAQSFPNLGYVIMSEMLKSEGSSTPMLVVDGTFFASLSSPDDYLIAKGSSGSGSGTTPPIEQGQ